MLSTGGGQKFDSCAAPIRFARAEDFQMLSDGGSAGPRVERKASESSWEGFLLFRGVHPGGRSPAGGGLSAV